MAKKTNQHRNTHVCLKIKVFWVFPPEFSEHSTDHGVYNPHSPTWLLLWGSPSLRVQLCAQQVTFLQVSVSVEQEVRRSACCRPDDLGWKENKLSWHSFATGKWGRRNVPIAWQGPEPGDLPPSWWAREACCFVTTLKSHAGTEQAGLQFPADSAQRGAAPLLSALQLF